MSEKQKRLLFLCAHRSVRELMAASLLAAQEQNVWDIWIAPASFPSDAAALVRQCSMKSMFPCFPSFKQQNHPLIALGMRVLCFVAVQRISDRSSPTPVGVGYGPLKMLQI